MRTVSKWWELLRHCIGDSPRWGLARIGFLIVRAGFPQRQILGFPVIDTTPNGVPSVAYETLERALQLVEGIDPTTFRYLRGNVRYFMLEAGPGLGHYNPDSHLCRMAVRILERWNPKSVAVVLVHEATHARIWRARIPYTKENRGRIERICIEAEIAFARQLDGGEGLIEWSTRRLQDPDPSDTALYEQRIAQMEASGVPQWMINRAHRLHKPRAE